MEVGAKAADMPIGGEPAIPLAGGAEIEPAMVAGTDCRLAQAAVPA
jgi:hypothetical protein